MSPDKKLYLVHISIHGLIRGHELELGRDADTGGQTKYAVELAEALGRHPEVGRVDLLTRQVIDPRVSSDYSVPLEDISDNVFIRRITCGPKRYIRKERLWNFLDVFSDQALLHLRSVNRLPDLIHAHYADAGYVGRQLAHLIGCPFIFTGHSLGRVKLQQLLKKGDDEASLEKRYAISRRIEAEELSLDAASLVVTSTAQEVRDQYELYDQYAPERMRVIPPGVDLSRFSPPTGRNAPFPIAAEIDRFLRDPSKPPILALSRADERKNIETLVRAYAENASLRAKTNLILIAGNRDNIEDLDSGARRVWRNLLNLIDRYDLYGSVAYPKHHSADDVPDIYRLAARRQGVFVNPALTEPFGLTLLEAAASGLPVVATNDGGPVNIIENCNNGSLIDPLDAPAMAEAIAAIVLDRERWKSLATAGLKGVRHHYSWQAHVKTYLGHAKKLMAHKYYGSPNTLLRRDRNTLLPLASRLVVADLDNILTGNRGALSRFRTFLKESRPQVAFGIATGRNLATSLHEIETWEIPFPDVLITSLGGGIFYGKDLIEDRTYEHHLDYHWHPDRIRKILDPVEGLYLQAGAHTQERFKISYDLDPEIAPPKKEIVRLLRHEKLRTRVFVSHDVYLDVIPIRSSKGLALRYLSVKWGIPQGRILVAADSGNDIDMIQGNTLGVVVRNHTAELNNPLRGQPRVYYARKRFADGILEGIEYYHFSGEIEIPEEEATPSEGERIRYQQ
ncbi:HAD-IIB family hydrolase [soil metagenome]